MSGLYAAINVRLYCAPTVARELVISQAEGDFIVLQRRPDWGRRDWCAWHAREWKERGYTSANGVSMWCFQWTDW